MSRVRLTTRLRLCAVELNRDGTTIHSDVEISYVDAILGVTTPVRTVDGQVGILSSSRDILMLQL